MNISALDIQLPGQDIIPYSVRTQINQIDPKLDIFWPEYLLGIIKELSDTQRKNIVVQLLRPKNIYWNSAEKTFEYRSGSREDSLLGVISDIPLRLPHFKAFADGTVHHLKSLQQYENVEQIADFLENILEKIQTLDVGSDFELRTLKQRLHTEFIYACAAIIRQKDNLILPQNRRGLNTYIIKTFINEVYLKQQLLGYWFKTVSNHQLSEMPHELLNTFLRREQKVRQLEIIRTSKYLFAIAPGIDSDSNPFAIRRFLQEDTLFSQNRVVFHGAALNPALLQNQPTEYQNRFRQQIAAIITLESQVRTEIFDFLEELEIFHDTRMQPVLFTPFPANQPINRAVPARLQQYENLLNGHILEPLRYTLRHNVGNQDEFDVLYIGVRQVFNTVISTFKEFLALPALLLNEEAEQLFGRLVAYTLFLEKRRHRLFALQNAQEWSEAHRNIEQPFNELHGILQQNAVQFRNINKEINTLQSNLYNAQGFVDKLFHRRQKDGARLEQLKHQAAQMREQAYHQVLELPRKYPERIVHLEAGALAGTAQAKHHYAFPTGDNGVSRLPFVAALPLTSEGFNPTALANELKPN